VAASVRLFSLTLWNSLARRWAVYPFISRDTEKFIIAPGYESSQRETFHQGLYI